MVSVSFSLLGVGRRSKNGARGTLPLSYIPSPFYFLRQGLAKLLKVSLGC